MSSAAAVDYSGTYLCVDEFGGGVAYNALTKRWEGATFTPHDKTVFSLAFHGLMKDSVGSDVRTYNVHVSVLGESGEPAICYGDNIDTTVPMWGDVFRCDSYLSTYIVNLSKMRSLITYVVGYFDGADNHENTPSILGGSCTRIN